MCFGIYTSDALQWLYITLCCGVPVMAVYYSVVYWCPVMAVYYGEL